MLHQYDDLWILPAVMLFGVLPVLCFTVDSGISEEYKPTL